MHLALASAGFTATGLADALRRVGDAPASNEEVTRLQSIVGPLMNMALQDGRTLIGEAVASTKPTKESKPDHVVEVRATECRNIYGALKLIPGFSVENLGWHRANAAAKEALRQAGINNQGNPRLTDEEKAKKELEGAYSVQDALAIQGDTTLSAEDKIKKLADLKAAAAAKVVDEAGMKHARRIVKTEGIAYARTLIGKLERAIAEAEADADAKAVAKAEAVAPALAILAQVAPPKPQRKRKEAKPAQQ